MRKYLISFIFILVSAAAAVTTPEYGIKDNTPSYTALYNANIVTEPGALLENAVIVMRDGIIEAVGSDVELPAAAMHIDMRGKWIYPAFIELLGSCETGKKAENAKKQADERNKGPVYEVPRKGKDHWNPAVKADYEIAGDLKYDKKLAEYYLEKGFAAVQFIPEDGIFRGFAALSRPAIPLPSEAIVKDRSMQFMSFSKGTSALDNPSSLMGSIALIRQTFMDADGYAEMAAKEGKGGAALQDEFNAPLQSISRHTKAGGTFCFIARDELDLFRIDALRREFDLNAIAVGSNYEYRRADAVAALDLPLILPLKMPAAPKIDPGSTNSEIKLAVLKHWDTAPANAAILAGQGIKFALSSAGLKEKDDILAAVRTLISYGLAPDKALAALTSVPAEFLGLKDSRGRLLEGFAADLMVTDAPIFSKNTRMLSVWVKGEEQPLIDPGQLELPGVWTAVEEDAPQLLIDLAAKEGKIELTLIFAADTVKAKQAGYDHNTLTAVFDKDKDGTGRFKAIYSDENLSVNILNADGSSSYILYTEKREFEGKGGKTDISEEGRSPLYPVQYPENPFGMTAAKRSAGPANILFKNAEIWTMGPEGILQNADLLMKDGKITAVGKALQAGGNTVVRDMTGRIITPGIIDAHSHLAISGRVNEGTEAVTAETRIGDVIDSDDVNIYRQLAGGTTACLTLHGSANPIGALNQVIKLKWGALPQDMKVPDVKHRTIKFALGENVKQSNWGDLYTTRYPQSRMGVEAIIRDYFYRAQDYSRRLDEYASLSRWKKKSLAPPRRDIELEHLAAVLNGSIKIHCHSYVQSEIQMMTRLSKEFGLAGGTFVHVLEGYKVAHHIRDAGWNATTFSDWWAYKFEVYDAIPYNAALMHEQGVNVSINSDDYELGRHLNTDAAKAVKYGNVDREEAFKMVTINAAKQIFIDHRTGSLEAGKDADLVIWNADPLSPKALALESWIEGKKYFDREKDAEMRIKRDEMKHALLQKLLAEGDPGKKSDKNEKGGEK